MGYFEGYRGRPAQMGAGIEGVKDFGIMALGIASGKAIYGLTPFGPIHTFVGLAGGIITANVSASNRVKLYGYSLFSALGIEGVDFAFDGLRHFAENVIYHSIRTPDEALRDWMETYFPRTAEGTRTVSTTPVSSPGL